MGNNLGSLVAVERFIESNWIFQPLMLNRTSLIATGLWTLRKNKAMPTDPVCLVYEHGFIEAPRRLVNYIY